jgi:signal transduction histidine kinase
VNALGSERRAHADRDLLYRVLVNLGRNAFDAGATTVTVAARSSGAYLLIDVTDNGNGVPSHVVSQLFRPFTTGGRAGGAGLGLAIARELVRAHGGEIVLSHTGATGTTFQFTLPRDTDAKASTSGR